MFSLSVVSLIAAKRSANGVLFGAWVLLWALFGFASSQAATLNSIAITPATPSLDVAQSQSFVATGTFSDSSTQILDSVPTQIVSNYYDTCELLADGKIKCWGGNLYGQLGNGTTTDSIIPVTVSGITTATAVAAGYYSTCALLADGTVKCWGDNHSGQLGDGTNNPSLAPVTVSGISTATAIAAGYGHTCALLANKTVWCWGDNTSGQLGDGTTNDSSIPVQVSGISSAMEIAAGYQHTCARLSDHTIRCWGDNSTGQLGNGGTSPSYTPVPVSGIDGTTVQATAIAAGYGHSCALLADKTVWCWGKNSYGQLGVGNYTESDVPVMVSGIDGTTVQATAIAAGQSHSCALLSSGAEQCWGFNYYGQLGNNSTTSSNVPVSVNGISSATALTAGNFHSCALLGSGQIQCWGSNQYGQLGNGVAIQATTPVNVNSIGSAAAVAAGSGHSCALMLDGTVECWGFNQYGQLGNGSSVQQSSVPVVVSGIGGASPKAAAIAAGAFHTCALLENFTVKCWGNNDLGELGNGLSNLKSTTPVAVSGIDGSTVKAIAITAGHSHSCALISGGTVKCWGYNYDGELGDGTTSNSNTPVDVSAIDGLSASTQAAAIAAGAYHTCARLNDYTVECWGNNNAGRLGDGTTSNSSTPVAVSGIDGTTVQAMAIAAGYAHSCVQLADNSMECWGDNSTGQLGNGSTTSSDIPVAVSGITSAAKIALGHGHSCAQLWDSTVECWGSDTYGQLGDGTTDQVTTPVQVSGIDGATVQATAIALGDQHSCALISGGTVKCWGDDTYGQLGDGTSSISMLPESVSGAPQVKWSSSNSGVATIDVNGQASALSPGTTTITATATDGSTSAGTTLTVLTYSVGGMVSGLSGTLVLDNYGGDSLSVSVDGNFSFATQLASGDPYNVTVATQPLGQTCAVSNGTGTVASGDVTNISVTCTTNAVPAYTVGGTISGLSGSVVLQNNGSDNLSVTANGGFTFAAAVASGSAYNVTVATQPSGQTCAVTNGSGTVGTSAVASVAVTCTTTSVNSFTVGGTVSGLSGTAVLQNNGGDSLTLTTDGSFTFAAAVASGSAYNVTVATQPTGQTCAVTNGSGTVGSAAVTGVSVACSDNPVTPLSNSSGGGGGGALGPLLLAWLYFTTLMRRSRRAGLTKYQP